MTTTMVGIVMVICRDEPPLKSGIRWLITHHTLYDILSISARKKAFILPSLVWQNGPELDL